MGGAILLLGLFVSFPLVAQRFRLIYRFQGGGDGQTPQAGLVRDGMGNLYGTTQFGGTRKVCGPQGPGCGTLFKVDAHGKETVLRRFRIDPTDGASPVSDLILDTSGNLYGTTTLGGSSNNGTVFRISSSSGQEHILYSFGAYPDGYFPTAGVIMDKDGNLYGTTRGGGSSVACWGGCGTVFKLDSTGKETILFNFSPPIQEPNTDLILDDLGNLYGTAGGSGWGKSLGAVFKLSRAAPEGVGNFYAFASLLTFTEGADGNDPTAIIWDADGNIYGVTFRGGDYNCIYSFGAGCGVVYSLAPNGKESVLAHLHGSAGRCATCGQLGAGPGWRLLWHNLSRRHWRTRDRLPARSKWQHNHLA